MSSLPYLLVTVAYLRDLIPEKGLCCFCQVSRARDCAGGHAQQAWCGVAVLSSQHSPQRDTNLRERIRSGELRDDILTSYVSFWVFLEVT